MKIINQQIQKLIEFQAQDVGRKLYQLSQKVGKKNLKSRQGGKKTHNVKYRETKVRIMADLSLMQDRRNYLKQSL